MAPLEGRFVCVHSLAHDLEPNRETQHEDPSARPLNLNGKQGYCLRWDYAEAKYVVLMFEGVVAGIPEENLSELEPAAPVDGGFDVAWPAATGMPDWEFAEIIGQCLAQRGYCVVQMFTSRALREAALAEAERTAPFEEPRAETEVAYLGERNTTRCGLLELDDGFSPVEGALSYCDRDLSVAGGLLAPLAQGLLGHSPSSRSSALVRTPVPGNAGADTQALSPALQDQDLMDSYVEKFLSWVMRRRLCMMYLVDNEGGTLELYPKGPDGANAVRLPLQRCRMVLFRHDVMSYSYQPEGQSVALQAWLQDEPRVIEFREIDRAPHQDIEGKDSVHIISAHECFPANCDGCDMTLRAFIGGVDALTPVPYTRFDEEPYLMSGDPLAVAYGKCYTMHGSFIDYDRLIGFDNEFFGIAAEEVANISPSQRWVLETGYVTLLKGGWTKQSLNGQRVGVFLGDSGSEWNNTQIMPDKYTASSNLMPVTVTRLGHCLNLKGPNLTVDTACSASLVAANSACHFMRRRTRRVNEESRVGEQGQPESLRHALCGGILVMLHPMGWIGECASKMLSLRGRCFTWDASADGFIRGEGCCCVYMRSQDGDEKEAKERHLAVMMGSNVTANGRGASLTAPSGPAQSMAINQSLREGGMMPQEVVIGECHGTATALGDPIEVGAVRTIMKKERELFPMMHATAKAHVGHEEANAGACALIKAVLMANCSISTPNPGLTSLNPNIDTTGYPVLFINELTTTSFPENIIGVSSFGFGGSIAICHVWADAEKGAHKDGRKVQIDHEEALLWINKAISNFGTGNELEGIYTGHKHGH